MSPCDKPLIIEAEPFIFLPQKPFQKTASPPPINLPADAPAEFPDCKESRKVPFVINQQISNLSLNPNNEINQNLKKAFIRS
jgi:hypothetical protein